MKTFIVKFLVNLKNNSVLKKEKLICYYSSYMLKILGSLYKEGLVQSYRFNRTSRIVVFLRYYFNKPIFKKLKFLSLPSDFMFVSLKTLSKLIDRKFTLFLSTTSGISTLKESKKSQVGGEALFYC